jgi:hypothetical protein
MTTDPIAPSPPPASTPPARAPLSLTKVLLLIGGGILAVTWLLGQFSRPASTPEPVVRVVEKPTPAPAPLSSTAEPATDISVQKADCRPGGFGTVGICTITLRNTGTVGYADIGYRVMYFGASGTRIGDQTGVIYHTLPAGATKTFKNLNVGRVPAQTAKFVFTIRSGLSRVI